MVEAGLGIMVASAHTPWLPTLEALPILDDTMRWMVSLLVVAGRRYTPALDAFIKVARLRDWKAGNAEMPSQRAENKEDCAQKDPPDTSPRSGDVIWTRYSVVSNFTEQCSTGVYENRPAQSPSDTFHRFPERWGIETIAVRNATSKAPSLRRHDATP